MLVWAPVIGLGLSVAASAAAALLDFRTGHIPNWLTYGTAGAGLVIQGLAAEQFGRGVLSGVAGMLICGLFPYILWLKDGIGGGDLKLLVALGAVLGYFHGIEAEFLAMCVGALFALARLAWHGKLLAVLTNSLFLMLNVVLPKKWRRDMDPSLLHKIRFGGAIFVGTTLAAVARFRL